MLNGLDLFSGIGGNSLALREYVNTVTYCEADRHAQAVLMSRMRDGLLPSRPIWDDVTTLRGDFLPPIDIIIGGFPCQDISVAGKGAGLEGERSGLFFQIVRLAEEIKPTFIFLENVSAIRTRGLDVIIQELTRLGYDIRWTMLSAEEVGAPHKRNRWFLLAYSDSVRKLQPQGVEQDIRGRVSYVGEEVANTDRNELRLKQGRSCGKNRQGPTEPERAGWWEFEPDVGRVANGVPLRMDRLKRLGNAVVPAQAKQAFKELMGLK